ncbi:20S proteasome subunit beta 6, partial [Pancytospora epiphaga]
MFKYFKTEPSEVPRTIGDIGAHIGQQHTDFNMLRPKQFETQKFMNLRNHLAGFKEVSPHKEEELTERDVYEDNSGTTLVLSIANKLIIASDTRHSAEYNINSRRMTRIFRLGDFFLTTTGFYADSFEVYTVMKYQIRQYENTCKIGLKAAAHLLCNILYSRRFFPYYTYACISGFENGVAGIYSFDSIGSYELVSCRCDGSSSKIIQPLLDSWIS